MRDREFVCVFIRESEGDISLHTCVCLRENVCDGEKERKGVFVCVGERKKERERERERETEKERVSVSREQESKTENMIVLSSVNFL